jgi:DNA-binding transcriptional MerR regulator
MMSDMREEPFFNLKAVIKQTGLKPDTLRAWERRYGIPSPERSAGRHRLYSQHDISTIKWLVARQQEGMSIKRAVELWRQIEEEGRDPLISPTLLATQQAPALAPRIIEGTIAELRSSWIQACLAYDERTGEQVLAQAFAIYPPETVCLELLQKAMAQMGKGWYEGEVSVQQEHFCSALAIRHVEALVMAAPPPTRPGRILAACPPGEQHVFGLLLITLLLRRRGWEVIYLGANVPEERLDAAVAATQPQLVILAAQQLHSAATLLDTAQVLQQAGVPLAYGGLIFNLSPALRHRIPGHFLGEELESAPQVAESLLIAPRPMPHVEAVPESCHRAREHFLERHWLIESHLDHALAEMGIAPQYFAIANRELATNIDAALSLGDMGFLGSDIEWVEGLLKNHGIPAEALHGYLAAYFQAARQQLDERGRPIIAWLDALVLKSGIN